jgi:hypothetical protein
MPLRLHVLPARTVPQGVAAMIAFDPQAGLARNLQRMREAIAAAHSLEVREQEGRLLGLLEGRPVAEGEGLAQVLSRLLDCALQSAAGAQRLALFYGAGVSAQQAREIDEELRRTRPGLEVEILAGGQPGRGLIVSLE